MKKIEKQYTFADSIFSNYSELLEAAISFHFYHVPKHEVAELSDDEIRYDANSIADGLLHPDYDEVEYTAGLDDVHKTREELTEDIIEKTKEMYR